MVNRNDPAQTDVAVRSLHRLLLAAFGLLGVRMNKTLMFLQADMHRAINEGRRHVEVSVLDLKELLSQVLKCEYQEIAAQAHIFAWIDPTKLKELRESGRYYASIRRGKNKTFSEPIFCLPKPKIGLPEEEPEGIIESA